MSSIHMSHTSNWINSLSAPFAVENVVSSGTPTQAAYDMVVARNRVLEDQIRARDHTIAQQRAQLEDVLADKAEIKMQLTESYEVSKMLKEGKEELFLAVVNLNERLEAQNKISSEAQSVFLKLPAAIRALRRLDDETVKLRKEKTDQEKEIDSLRRLLTSSQEENEKSLSQVNSIRSDYADSLSSFKDVKHTLEKANAAAVANATSANAKLEEVRLTLIKEKQIYQAERESQLEENEKLKSQLETRSLMLTLKSPKAETDDEEEQTVGMDKEILQIVDSLKYNLFKSEMARKQLHNQLQELRGNIRVFVRCRPYINYDGDDSLALENASVTNDSKICGSIRFYKDGSSVALAGCIKARDKPQIFAFDQVFRTEATQEEIFKEVTELVQSALDGYRVCIFSYGQTGSGKTHTMAGSKDGPMRGIIPRAVEQTISQVINMRANGWEISVTASMVEIYNEEVRDLLDTTPGHLTSSSEKSKLKISNLQGFVTIAGLTSIELDSTDLKAGVSQLEGLLDIANKTRMVACTAMNERSSRSHALFMLDITAKHTDSATVIKGGLRLVDLAGSERADRSGSASDPTRFKETVNINKSLSCLADVFIALGNKSSHIPYRNSKLTLALQDCLSGDGKALMFVNISPTHASAQETLCSLRFANQVSQVELGKASKNVTSLSPPPPALIKDDHKVPLNKDRAPSSNIVVNLAAQKTNKGVQSKNTRSTPSRGIRPAKTQSEIIAERMRRKEKGAQSDNSETSSESSTSFSRAYNFLRRRS